MVGSDGKQPVPALGGFISATGRTPVRKSTIDYFTPINQPITEYSTVQELLRQSEVATAEVALVLPSELGTAVGVTLSFNSMKVFTNNLAVETSIP